MMMSTGIFKSFSKYNLEYFLNNIAIIFLYTLIRLNKYN